MLTLDDATPPNDRPSVTRAVSFLKPYLLGLAGSLYLFTFGWARRKNRAAIVELGHHFGYRHETRVASELPVVTLNALTPENLPIEIRALDSVDGNVTDRELVTICRIVRSLVPRNIFEFGTFDGRTTLNLAANVGTNATVFTLDLPSVAVDKSVAPIHRDELRFVEKARSGERYRNTDLEARIVSLYGDSGSFDYSPYEGRIDLVFIDGSHTFEYVINDSLEALRLLGEKGGTILWHDYGRWDGVTTALHELKKRRAEFANLVQVAGTTLAVARVTR